MPWPAFDATFFALAAVLLTAGIVRGFSGFGTALIAMPLGAAIAGPQTMVVVLTIVDTLPMLPLIAAAVRQVRVISIVPVFAGYLLIAPIGVWILTVADTDPLRWVISIVVLLACALLWSGWKYTGPRNIPVRMGVGGLSGLLGGATGMNGPPVILYWMAQEQRAINVRAHLITFFALTNVAGAAMLFVAGIITWERVLLGVAMMPAYFIGLMIGARLFGRASDDGYRKLAFLLILAAAMLGLPVWSQQ